MANYNSSEIQVFCSIEWSFIVVLLLVVWCHQANELQPLGRGPDHPMQIMWTSSSNAKKDAFQLDDIQHANGLVECLPALWHANNKRSNKRPYHTPYQLTVGWIYM